MLLHERQATDKPQRRKPRKTVRTLRMLWGLWRLASGAEQSTLTRSGVGAFAVKATASPADDTLGVPSCTDEDAS